MGEQTCVAPAAHHDDYIYMLVSRAGKVITLMACIAAGGSTIKLQIIIAKNDRRRSCFYGINNRKSRRPITPEGICHDGALRRLILLHLPP
jgi:hypothetical protein